MTTSGRTDAAEIVKGIQEIAANASQSNIAAQQALKGSQDIAAAAEERPAEAGDHLIVYGDRTGHASEKRQVARAGGSGGEA